MKLYLERYGSSPMGTFGELRFSEKTQANGRIFEPHHRICHTVERRWVGNKPFVSCVPRGTYRLRWLPTTTNVPALYQGHTWYLEGPTVSTKHSSSKARTRCCFHIANVEGDVNGCVGAGDRLSTLSTGEWAVLNSVDTLQGLLEVLGPADHDLVIGYTETQ